MIKLLPWPKLLLQQDPLCACPGSCSCRTAVLPWEGAALLAVLPVRAGSASHQVIQMRWERSACARVWCSSCCAASGWAGKTVTATRVSHPLHGVLLAVSPWAQETGLGTFSGMEALGHRVTHIHITVFSYPVSKVGMALGRGTCLGGQSLHASAARNLHSLVAQTMVFHLIGGVPGCSLAH